MKNTGQSAILHSFELSTAVHLKITPILSFTDNYIWCIYNTNTKSATVIDPGDAFPVLEFLKQNNFTLENILVTHYHGDHIGGIDDLKKHFPNVNVFAPQLENINHTNYFLQDNDIINLNALDRLEFKIIDVRGHTKGHIAYYNESNGILFSGDTLFAGGCGRVFEGTYAQMYDSLQKLAVLPKETFVFCTHEYTLSNLNFAKAVEPNNLAIEIRIELENQKLFDGLPTLPSTLELEFLTNPFLRCDIEDVQKSVSQSQGSLFSDDVSVFSGLREWKNNF